MGEGDASYGVATAALGFGLFGARDKVGDAGGQATGLLADGAVAAAVGEQLLRFDGGDDRREGDGVAAGGALASGPVSEVGEAGIGIGVLPGAKPGEPGGMVVGDRIVAGIAGLGDEGLAGIMGVGVVLEVGILSTDLGRAGFPPRAEGRQDRQAEKDRERGPHVPASVNATEL